MSVTSTARHRTHVQLPADVTRPFQVYLNGVLQQEGTDYVVRSGTLVFETELREEGKLGLIRWASITLGIAGSYGRNDSVDVVYQRDGQPVVAAKLRVEASPS